ncbi:hypothetical protein ACFOUP_10710 [Belliella kenyensis]|uniref:DsrE/DsrF-like family protein n=1 Tax=Belliella kenyensis TaxID=1472724 RepID=A0ABV8ENF9_9BACT|nr:hypothetical protein [Belliella kenyensis]MCH7400459.1 hypothetical protein [Belliella kenyensis]MDN3604525.1 hypothetical protein [Belliella kenyensis]
MKSSIIIILVLVAISTSTVQSQTTQEIQKTEQSIKKNGKYASLVMRNQHLEAAILTGKSFKNKSKKIDFQIVVCGELVKEIIQDTALQSLIEEGVNQHGLKVLICGLSINRLNLDKEKLPQSVTITENGLIYMFGLQEQGFKTVIL